MKLSLKAQTRAIYAILLASFIGLGALAMDRIALVSHASSVMRTVWMPRLQIAGQLDAAASDYRTSEGVRIMSTSPEMASHADADLAENAKLFESTLADYRKQLQPGESPAGLDKIEQLWRAYQTANQPMLAMAASGDTAGAADRYRNSASRFYLIAQSLDELIATDVGHSTAASMTADRVSKQARAILFGAIGVVTLIIVAAAVFLELRVWRVLVRLSGVMQRLAHKDFEVEVVGARRGDEVGGMARAVQVFKDNGLEVERLEAEKAAREQAAAEERRLHDAAQAEAAAQRAHVVACVADGLAALSQGDLTYRIDKPFAPEFQKLADDFNSAIGQQQDTLAKIKSSILGIRAGADEISQSADDLSRRTEQQAASLEETAAALDQITSTVRRTAEGSAEASKMVLAATTDAERSSIVVRDAVNAMSEIEQSARQISQIIGVIDEIAFQTNLLALNAGVEAARAGEAGRGFAVVASEVRGLAQRSAAAAKEIKALISTSTGQVASGVQLVGQTGQALERILINIGEINTLVADFAAAASEQAGSLHEVNSAVDQMDHSTQQNASMVEENTAASFALASEAQQLAQLIERFDTGVTPEPAARPAADYRNTAPAERRPRTRLRASGAAAVLATAEPDVSEDGWEEF